MTRRLAAACLAVLLALCLLAPRSPAAHHRTYDVKACYPTLAFPAPTPLRYGNRHWGYRHIKARRGFTKRTDRLIRRTLAGYERYVASGDRWTFLRYRPGVVEVVVVGFNLIPHARNGNQIVGIITAYRKKRDGRRKRGFIPPNISVPPADICPG